MQILQEVSRFDLISHSLRFKSSAHSFHWHDKYELCQVVNKSCRFRVGGRLINASRGDIIAINEHIVHQFLIDEDDTMIRVVQFPFQMLMSIDGTPRPLKSHITAEEIRRCGIFEKLESLFCMMDEEQKTDTVNENPFFRSLVISAYLLLERHFSDSVDVAFSRKDDRRVFHNISEYVNAHFKENISVESISRELYCSRGKLTAVFKKYAGVSVKEYISILRIKNINRMLSAGANITEAALECGFQSIRAFNNVYKQIMNMTPSEYIKANFDTKRSKE